MASQRIGGKLPGKVARKSTKTRSAQRDARKTNIGAGWQAEKSALTRQAILEAAVRCFVQHGYTNTTTAMIAEEGDVSRGAMMHHFPRAPRSWRRSWVICMYAGSMSIDS